jgi:Flp pilus assembly protein TadG
MPNSSADRSRHARARARAGRRSARISGQSLVEFALTLPMVLLMVLFGLDFGRVYLGWVELNNAVREAANYAAINPDAWGSTPNFAVQSEYARLVMTETADINCTLPGSVPDPTFPSGTTIGSPAVVAISCRFHLITPLIAVLTGNPIAVSASSAFPIRTGLIADIPTPAPTSSPSPTPTVGPTATPGPTGTPAPTGTAAPSATPTAAPTPTPVPQCTVPSFLDVQSSQAQSRWSNAGFSGAIIYSPLVPPTYRIHWQSLTVGTDVACTSGITVSSTTP